VATTLGCTARPKVAWRLGTAVAVELQLTGHGECVRARHERAPESERGSEVASGKRGMSGGQARASAREEARRRDARPSGGAWPHAWRTHPRHVLSVGAVLRTDGGQWSDRRGSQFWAISGLNLDMDQEAKLEPTRCSTNLIKEPWSLKL
jgi:hypothetical protein